MSSTNVLFKITTNIESKDYRRFSYLTIFIKKYQTTSLIALLAAIGAGFVAFTGGEFRVANFLIYWISLIITEYVAICLMVEYKNLKRMNLVKSGLLDPKQTISFYDNYLVAESEHVKAGNKIKYDFIFKILESENYYIVYTNANKASLIRKSDISNAYQDDFKTFLKTKIGKRYSKI